MGSSTGISWADRTKSAWHGCSHAPLDDGTTHPGCTFCYAELGSGRNQKTLGIWGEDGTRVQSKSFAKDCETWQKEAEAANTIFTVFPSIHDPFEDRPELDPWRLDMFKVIDNCPSLLFLLLTKRPANIIRMIPPVSRDKWSERFAGTNTGDPNWRPTPEQKSGLTLWHAGHRVTCQRQTAIAAANAAISAMKEKLSPSPKLKIVR